MMLLVLVLVSMSNTPCVVRVYADVVGSGVSRADVSSVIVLFVLVNVLGLMLVLSWRQCS